VPERRHLPEELWQDVLARDEELDGVDAHGSRRREEAGLLTVLARREELPDEPELLVLT
jgi:hypothetical protein